MSLSVGLGLARSSLFVTSEQTATVSRNVANADNPLYTRKTSNVVNIPGTGPRIVSVTRATDPVLFRNLLTANSDANTQSALLEALNQLEQTINDPELDSSPGALLSKLSDAIQQYSAQPHSDLAGQAAVRAAQNMSNGLNSASSVVTTLRREADAGIDAAVGRMNSLLTRFESVNDEIVKGTRSGADVTDYMDARDQILSELSTELGVRTLSRGDNDIAVFTDSGVTLFDKTARAVSFDRTLNPAPGVVGNAVLVDGVAITGASAPLPIASGAIKGLVEVRDDVTVGYQRQLDEMARGLITHFAEVDQNALLPDAAGLFTYAGGPGIPAAATIIDGLAAEITINPNADPDQGGLVTRLRDGGIADPLTTDYVYNTSGGASFSDRLLEIQDNLNSSLTYDPLADIDVDATLFVFSTSSIAWLEEQRRVADSEFQYRETLYQRSAESYSKVTGVNLDEEMTTLLELERSYQASSRLVTVIDEMFATLVQAVG
jgi:flagellar hook-associated protein 1